MKAFTTTPVATQKALEFSLDGKVYTFNPPKSSSQLVGLLQVRGKGAEADLERVGALLGWFGNGLDAEHQPKPWKKYEGHTEYTDNCQACEIDGMLQDPTPGSLELETVMEIINGLMEEVSGRPTT